MPIVGFLKIAKIPGESLVRGHENEIDVSGFAWKVQQASGGGGRATGRAVIGGVTLFKVCDASSAHLALAAMRGTHFPAARLAVDRPGRDHFEYLTIELSDCLVSSYDILPPDPAATASAGERIHERVELTFQEVKFTYTEQGQDGGPGKQHQIQYDIARGK